MTYIKQTHNSEEVPDSGTVQQSNRPYWKRAHKDWRFWIALLLMIAAMIIYVVSEDFAWLPRNRLQQPRQSSSGNNGAK